MTRTTRTGVRSGVAHRSLACLALCAAVSLASAYPTGPAYAGPADDAFLKSLAGEWKGKGKLKPTVTAKVERVSCRMNSTWDGGSNSLSIKMTCRGVDIDFSSSGFLRTLKRNNVVEGRWTGTAGVGRTSVLGKRNGNTLNLTLTNHDAKSGKSISGSVSMQLSGGGHALSNTVHGKDRDSGKNFRILSLSMKK
ncbi:MAG: hypothetical protein ACR2PM_06515 [Hyphomicrobiales bacterium]